MWEKLGNFTSSQGKFKCLKESGRMEILRVQYLFLFSLLLLCCVPRILFMKLTDKRMFGFQENQSLLHVIC